MLKHSNSALALFSSFHLSLLSKVFGFLDSWWYRVGEELILLSALKVREMLNVIVIGNE